MALSQKDVEELINSVMKKSDSEAKPQIAKPRLRVYDFRRPDKFTKDQLRGVQLLFDNFSRQLTSYFSGLFRMAIHANVNSIDQVTYQEFAKGLSSPCCVGIVNWGKLPSNMLVNVSLKVALPMLDRQCGGGGNPPGVSRTLTEIEMAMTRRTVQNMVDLLRMSLREFHVRDDEITVNTLEVNPLFIQQALPPSDMVLSASVSLKFGAQTGTVEFCMPYTLLEPVLPALSANRWLSRGDETQSDGQSKAALSGAIDEIEVPLSCRLGGTRLPMKDVLSLEKGDVLELNVAKNSPAMLYVFGRPKFSVKVGTVENRLAARIISLAEDGEEDPV